MSRISVSAPFALPAAPDTAAAYADWLRRLGAERRLSPNTVEAYGRDVRILLGFLQDHLGGPASVADITALKPRDVRAFMAARRTENISSRSLMRALAAARSFARHLARAGLGEVSAFSAVRSPKVARSLPKPIPAAAARRLVDADERAGEERAPWVLARDAAVLALLYGCGLRISEALSLTRREAPTVGVDRIEVTGKGAKRPSSARSRTISSFARGGSAQKRRCSSARRAGRSTRASCRRRWRACGARSACPTRRRRMRCATPSRRICCRAAAT
jgi:integrase/recombinase XerC